MNTANSKSTLLNNSFTSNTHDKICNSFGCLNKATEKIVLPIGSKSLTIVVCESCKLKFV